METIRGPVNGFYLAAYAAPADDGEHFCCYAKVCWSRPASYWEADCAFKLFGGDHHRSPESALAAVAQHACDEISILPRHARNRVRLRRRRSAPSAALFAAAASAPRWA